MALQVVSVLAKAQRNGSLTSDKARGFLEDLQALSITVDLDGIGLVFANVYPLAVARRLSGHDASYLELPVRNPNRRGRLEMSNFDIVAFSPILSLSDK